MLAALQQKSRHFLNKQRHAAGALSQAVNHFLGQRIADRKLADHVPHLRAIKRSQGDRAVMRTHAPGSPKLRSSRDNKEQWRQRTAFGKAGARSGGNGMSSSGDRSVAFSTGSSLTSPSVFSRSAKRLSAGTSAPPKR